MLLPDSAVGLIDNQPLQTTINRSYLAFDHAPASTPCVGGIRNWIPFLVHSTKSDPCYDLPFVMASVGSSSFIFAEIITIDVSFAIAFTPTVDVAWKWYMQPGFEH